MIVIDNCILSSFSKIKRIELLKHLKDPHTSPGVIEEVLNSDMDVLIKSIKYALDNYLMISSYSYPQEIPDIQDKYPRLSYVDCELILLSKTHGCPLLTDDTDLIAIAADKFDIKVFDLCEFLMAMKNSEVLDLADLNDIIHNLERKDHYKFSKKCLRLLKQDMAE